jgi:hypothetical protein
MTAAGFVVVLIILILWINYGEFWQIDRCLDSGGAWNYSSKECEH